MCASDTRRSTLLSLMLAGSLLLSPLWHGPASGSPSEPGDESGEDLGSLQLHELAGPFASPTAIAFLPDGSILLTEREGVLNLIRPGGDPVAVAGLPSVLHKGHGGLIDVAVDPHFESSRTIFLSYLHGTDRSSSIRVLRAQLDLETPRLKKRRVIFAGTPNENTDQLGGRLLITSDGYLFLTVGDRWERDLAQDLATHAGSIIRIRTDGSVPGDNPFIGREGARPEIWTYGHRNPQGLAFDSQGRLWSVEHGPRGGDELNLIIGGRNYGWPVITHGEEYRGGPIGVGTAKEGMEQPERHWTPAIAPSSLAFDADRNAFWISALAGQMLVRLDLRDGHVAEETRLLKGELGRIRDVRLGPDGLLYLVQDGRQAWLFRLDPAVAQAGVRIQRRRL